MIHFLSLDFDRLMVSNNVYFHMGLYLEFQTIKAFQFS